MKSEDEQAPNQRIAGRLVTVAAIGLVILIQLGLYGVAGGFVWRLFGGAFWKGFIFGAVVGQALFMGYQAFFAGRLGRRKDDLGSEPPQLSIRSRLATDTEARSPTPSLSAEEVPTSGSEDNAALNLSSLEAFLGDLLHAYRSALMFVEGLPFVERRLVRAPGFWRALWEQLRRQRPDPSSTQRRLVVRPLLRLFVQAHVRKQLLHMIRVLQIERLSLRGSDPPSKELGGMIEDLVRGEGQLFGWGRIRAALSKAPLIPAALAFMLAVYQVATGIDLTSGAAFGRTAAESARTIGWGGVARLLSILLYVAIFVYALVVAPAAVAGFKRKRAVFMGGHIPDGDERLPWPFFWLPRGPVEWPGFPETNVYEAEDGLFKLLDVKKRPEVPVDIFFSVGPYFALWGSVLIGLQAVQQSDWAGVLSALVLFSLVINSWISSLSRRIKSGNR